MKYSCIFCKELYDDSWQYGEYTVYVFSCGISDFYHKYQLVSIGKEVSRENIYFENYYIGYFYETKEMCIQYNNFVRRFDHTADFYNTNKITTPEQAQNFLLLS